MDIPRNKDDQLKIAAKMATDRYDAQKKENFGRGAKEPVSYEQFLDEAMEYISKYAEPSADRTKSTMGTKSRVVIPGHPQFGDVTEEEIEYAMSKHGLSRDEVISRLKDNAP